MVYHVFGKLWHVHYLSIISILARNHISETVGPNGFISRLYILQQVVRLLDLSNKPSFFEWKTVCQTTHEVLFWHFCRPQLWAVLSRRRKVAELPFSSLCRVTTFYFLPQEFQHKCFFTAKLNIANFRQKKQMVICGPSRFWDSSV